MVLCPEQESKRVDSCHRKTIRVFRFSLYIRIGTRKARLLTLASIWRRGEITTRRTTPGDKLNANSSINYWKRLQFHIALASTNDL